MTKLIYGAAFAAGFATIAWIGAGYVGHTLALAVTVLIALVFLAGAWELFSYRRATRALSHAVHGLSETPDRLDAWLPPALPESLRVAVHQRVEGLRAGLPGPVLATYLTGLLVLLGMLGTFLGMVITLQGTGAALLGAEGLQAIRDALAAPVRGLGLAFGTSVAGVGASAALGLMAAMSRRERLQVSQRLDHVMATFLRPYTPQHQRETSLRLMEQQVQLMPELVARMTTFMSELERQQSGLGERLATEQARFHATTESAYSGLATSVAQTLTASAAESARHAGAAIQPAIEAALAGLASHSVQLQTSQADHVRTQLDGIAARFGEATSAVAEQWNTALSVHEAANRETMQALRQTLDGFSEAFDSRSAALTEGLARQLNEQVATLASRWDSVLDAHHRSNAQLAEQHEQALNASVHEAEQTYAALHARVLAQDEARQTAWAASLQGVAAALQSEWQQVGDRSAVQWQALGDTLSRMAEGIAEQLQTHAERSLSEVQTLMDAASAAPRQAAEMIQDLQKMHVDLESRLAEQAEARQAGWSASLRDMASALQAEWSQAGERTAAQWQSLGDTLTRMAESISGQLEKQASNTLSEIGQLVQTASEAPRAASEVIGELRQKLSDSMVRDNEMLEERSHLLKTLSSLLETVNQASNEQRSAIDSLVNTASSMIESTAGRFVQTLDQQTTRMDDTAAQLSGSAVELASLGEAFGAGVQRFGEVNEQLMARLQQIEAALTQSLTRSDEQLDYYVAQAREVIELSTGAQAQIIEELRQLAAERET